jgi:hypothetical protein
MPDGHPLSSGFSRQGGKSKGLQGKRRYEARHRSRGSASPRGRARLANDPPQKTPVYAGVFVFPGVASAWLLLPGESLEHPASSGGHLGSDTESLQVLRHGLHLVRPPHGVLPAA